MTRDFAVPSPIQMETWPVACAGRDVIGVAATGSGKTLAFGLPALAHTQAQLAAGVAQSAVMPEGAFARHRGILTDTLSCWQHVCTP